MTDIEPFADFGSGRNLNLGAIRHALELCRIELFQKGQFATVGLAEQGNIPQFRRSEQAMKKAFTLFSIVAVQVF